MMPRGLFAGGLGGQAAPAEFGQPGVRFAFHSIGNQVAQNGGEFEAMPAAPGGDRQPGRFRVAVNPEMFVQRVAVEAAAGVDDGGVGQSSGGAGR